jgi:hypothetical protein
MAFIVLLSCHLHTWSLWVNSWVSFDILCGWEKSEASVGAVGLLVEALVVLAIWFVHTCWSCDMSFLAWLRKLLRTRFSLSNVLLVHCNLLSIKIAALRRQPTWIVDKRCYFDLSPGNTDPIHFLFTHIILLLPSWLLLRASLLRRVLQVNGRNLRWIKCQLLGTLPSFFIRVDNLSWTRCIIKVLAEVVCNKYFLVRVHSKCLFLRRLNSVEEELSWLGEWAFFN